MKSECSTAPLAKAHIQLQQRPQTELFQLKPMTALCRAVSGDQVRLHIRRGGPRRGGTRAGDKPVKHHRDTVRSCPENHSNQPGDLQSANFAQYIERIIRVWRIRFQHARHDVDFVCETGHHPHLYPVL